MERVHLTQNGYEKLSNQLDYLKQKKRREITAAIEHARSLGDLKENAEYHAAKEAMATNEQKIRELEDKLSRAEIIDTKNIDKKKAYLGAKVKLKDLESDEEIIYKLVGQDEANPFQDLISISSPVGKSLLGRKKGDIVKVEAPVGILSYEIIEISW
ncbi:MAG: transcription elongation factor GreA [Candidatus Omnitrophica bacterium]|nr:transcription elongation factor GreA [Candidatus Omnitrophota bacterium]